MTSSGVSPRPTDVAFAPDPSVQLLSLRGLRVQFRSKRGLVHAVDGISLDIRDGETVGLVGETGSGKSVTGRALLRLVPEPPGIYAGGQALFRPKRPCTACSGGACLVCGGTGKVDGPCVDCGGSGCETCGQTGRETVDLLTVPARQMGRLRGNNIAMVFQDPGKALNPTMTIRAQVAEVFTEHRWTNLLQEAGLDDGHWDPVIKRDAHGRSTFFERRLLEVPPWRGRSRRLHALLDDYIAAALANTNIPNPRAVMKRYPHELSGGMKQRVMIAQALACDPDLLIADEPTTALDVTVQARILDLISELQERHHTAVLYISHDLSLVRNISDKVAVMYAGQLAEVGTTEQVFDNPMHPYTRGLLAAAPSSGQRRGHLVAIEGNVPELIDPGRSCRFASRCPSAAPACHSNEPALLDHGGGHPVACLLYENPAAIGSDAADMPTPRSAS